MQPIRLFEGFGPTSLVVEILEDLRRDRRLGGLIPVPLVRELGLQRGLSVDQVHAALLWLDREYLIDLKVPNDPHLSADGLDVPYRGRAYFVVLR